MMPPPSLARRLILFLVALTVISSLIASAIGGLTLRREINEAMDRAMKEAAARLTPLVLDKLFGRDSLEGSTEMPASSAKDSNLMIYQVRDAQGRVLLRSHRAPEEAIAAGLAKGFADNDGWRVYTLPAVSDTIFVQVGEPLAERRSEMLEAASGFLIPMAIFVPMSALIAWFAASYFFRPLGGLLSEIGLRHGGNLGPIPTGDLPKELEPIAASVNGLMERLRAALEAEKEFAANAAHELRTPIAGALAQTQRLLAEAPDAPSRAKAEKIRAALARLAHLSEKLLQLARADSGIAFSGASTNLAELVKAVIAEYGRDVSGAPRVRIDLATDDEIHASIDSDALAIVMRNLIENAGKHGAKGQPVSVRVGPGREISVVNAGPVMPRDALETITQRFGRGPTMADGTGLGLAIANRILSQAGGRLELFSPVRGQADGFESRVSFGGDILPPAGAGPGR